MSLTCLLGFGLADSVVFFLLFVFCSFGLLSEVGIVCDDTMEISLQPISKSSNCPLWNSWRAVVVVLVVVDGTARGCGDWHGAAGPSAVCV